MSVSRSFLVVGGDSLVGGEAVAAFRRRGLTVLASTRRRETLGEGRIFIDFEEKSSFRMPRGINTVLVVAAATNYERCERDPEAYRTNVELIPRLIGSILEQGLSVIFISTNSVFGGDRAWPVEDDPPAPGIAYAKQKALGERLILEAADRLGVLQNLTIVRLTKVLSPETSPLPSWYASWHRGETVQPFSDLIFAPMTRRFVGESLATVAERRVSGNIHLSGAENVSYLEFARALANRLGIGPDLIQATTSVDKGVNIAFKPRYSGLGMERTTKLTGLLPQPLSDVVNELAQYAPFRTKSTL